MTKIPAIWKTKGPSHWATVPEWMSFHYLTEAERCPRAIALHTSDYEDVWSKHGYPDRPNPYAVIGQIVHSSVQTIVGELARHKCSSVRDPRSIEVLKKLGGYSTVIALVSEKILTSFDGNPRFHGDRDQITSNVRTRMPQIREQVQVFLSRLHWSLNPQFSEHGTDSGRPTSKTRVRLPLSKGIHSEVELRDPNLKWRGLADVIDLTDSECEISDLKTGAKSDSHKDQVMVYAVLWRGDPQLNPKGLLPTRLVLSYADGDEVLPTPTSQDLNRLASDLQIRTDQVRSELNLIPPEAKVTEENCKSCQVRLICNEYWNPVYRPKAALIQTSYDDIEVELLRQLGQTAWEAACRVSTLLKPTTKILIRFSSADQILREQFELRGIVRLTGALLILREAPEMPLLQIMENTEPLFL